jgi:hypothetical protein
MKQALAILAVAWAAILFMALAVQQNYRLSANDPQIQLAEDAAIKIGGGARPQDVFGTERVAAKTSLAPFVTVYDGGGVHEPLASTGYFDSNVLRPPAGTFDYAKAHGEERFTWQTVDGQREAAVLVYNGDAQPVYVLAARNLREVEAREDQLRLETLLALLGTALVVAVGTHLSAKYSHFGSKKNDAKPKA